MWWTRARTKSARTPHHTTTQKPTGPAGPPPPNRKNDKNLNKYHLYSTQLGKLFCAENSVLCFKTKPQIRENYWFRTAFCALGFCALLSHTLLFPDFDFGFDFENFSKFPTLRISHIHFITPHPFIHFPNFFVSRLVWVLGMQWYRNFLSVWFGTQIFGSVFGSVQSIMKNAVYNIHLPLVLI